jgi:hypothetical protein
MRIAADKTRIEQAIARTKASRPRVVYGEYIALSTGIK